MNHSSTSFRFLAFAIAVCYCGNTCIEQATGFMIQVQTQTHTNNRHWHCHYNNNNNNNPSASTSMHRQQHQQLLLYVDTSDGESVGGSGGGGGGGTEVCASSNVVVLNTMGSSIQYSQETIDSCQQNEWGIPSSQTLEPFGKVPRSQLPNGGRITLVGSGPGDPDLLTVKAYKLLTDMQQQQKDEDDEDHPDITTNTLVIADRLVSDEILDLIPCEIKVARKLPGCAEFAQEEIYFWTYEGLARGQHVIRLKIGDPFVFGRGGEEVLQFRQFGVEPTIVPGVSAAFSAPLLGNIPVTHRGVSNQVVMCTGYGREGTSPELIQYHAEQTIVFLMAVGRLRTLSERLVRMAGYPLETPVGIIERAGCPNQRTVVGTLSTIADIAEHHHIQAPSTIVVGKVVNVLLEKDERGIVSTMEGLMQNAATTTTTTTERVL